MKINGCVYGDDHACGNHGPRSEVTAYQKPGQISITVCPTPKVGPRGVWMKRAGERRVKPRVSPMREALNEFAHRKISYEMDTVIVRRRTA